MNNKLTLISHIFNEEYLLPFWLDHHSRIFDDAIIIDYYSTDNSVLIINQICPNWTVMKTKNIKNDGSPNFDAFLIDEEVKDIEKNIEGYKITLNITELSIFKDTKKSFFENIDSNYYYHISPYLAYSPRRDFYPAHLHDFLRNIINLIDKSGGNDLANVIDMKTYIYNRGHRILCNKKNVDYAPGRHFRFGTDSNIYTNDCFILWIGFYPFNEEMFKRKLQIQNNIPESDKLKGFGAQHLTDREDLIIKYDNLINIINNQNIDYSYLLESINKVVNSL